MKTKSDWKLLGRLALVSAPIVLFTLAAAVYSVSQVVAEIVSTVLLFQ